ncbi:MAG: primosome assembly protein PriA, partial [Rhodococcus sp. (in: high G+C Gram-positive bacteria)]
MLPLPHLDREFDYLVSEEMSSDAQSGVRVRVRFAGRLVDGFVLARLAETEHSGKLGWLDRVVSAERVLTPEIAELAEAVADRYAGTRADVLRLAIPARHARVEAEQTPVVEPPVEPAIDRAAWSAYTHGSNFLDALASGRIPRAVWQALPGERWPVRLAEAAAVTVTGGRSAVVVVPDQRDLDRLETACVALLGADRVVALS